MIGNNWFLKEEARQYFPYTHHSEWFAYIIPANTRHWTNAGLMLAQRRRRWDNISPALVQCLVFAGMFNGGACILGEIIMVIICLFILWIKIEAVMARTWDSRRYILCGVCTLKVSFTALAGIQCNLQNSTFFSYTIIISHPRCFLDGTYTKNNKTVFSSRWRYSPEK